LGPTNPRTAAPRPFQARFGAFAYLLRLGLRQRTQDRQQDVPHELVVGVEVRFRKGMKLDAVAVEAPNCARRCDKTVGLSWSKHGAEYHHFVGVSQDQFDPLFSYLLARPHAERISVEDAQA
jgi:hypothetical protein